MNDVTVKVNDKVFSDFESVYIRKSMEALTGIAIFTTANFYRHSQKKWDIFLGQSFDASINKTALIKGTLDGITVDYNSKSNSVEIIGRDKTSSLVDCDWNEKTNEWKKQTIHSIVSTLCKYFGISAVVDSSVSTAVLKRIDSFKINEGEKIFDAIKRVCIENSILPLSYGDNKLTLTAVSSNRFSKDKIQLGDNVESCHASHSNVNRYGLYAVKGYGKSSDFKSLSDYLQPYGYALDSVILNSKRKLVHLSDAEIDSGKATEQAKFLRNIHAGKSRAINYRIRDWLQSNGELWKINSLVQVNDEFLRIKKQMLIADLEFIYNKNDGWYTNVCVVDRNTYTKSDIPIKAGFDL